MELFIANRMSSIILKIIYFNYKLYPKSEINGQP